MPTPIPKDVIKKAYPEIPRNTIYFVFEELFELPDDDIDIEIPTVVDSAAELNKDQRLRPLRRISVALLMGIATSALTTTLLPKPTDFNSPIEPYSESSQSNQ